MDLAATAWRSANRCERSPTFPSFSFREMGGNATKYVPLELGTDDYVCKPFGQTTRATAIACTCSSHSCAARVKQTPIDLA
jgi:DNA-binding response OmpR family regulator